MTDYKVTRFISRKEVIIVEADDEDEAEEIALNSPQRDWEDQTDERLSEEIDVEEY